MELPPPATVEAEAGAAPTVPPPKGLRRGSLPPDLRPTPAAAGTPVGPITPSKVAQRLLEGLVMTPPKTPPPPSATPRNGTAFFPPGDRVRALREGSVTSQPSSPLAPAPGSPAAAVDGAPATSSPLPSGGGGGDENILPGTVPPTTAHKHNLSPLAHTPAPDHALPPVSGPAEFEGWLFKLKPGSVTGGEGSSLGKWNKRWFQLRDGFLLYYRAPGAPTPAGWLRVVQITSITDIPTDESIPGAAITPSFCFKIQLTTRLLYVHASSAAEASEWRTRLFPPGSTPATSRPRPLTVEPGASPPSYAQSPLGKHRTARVSASHRPSPLVPASAPAVEGEAKTSEDVSGPGEPVDIPVDAVWIKCYDPDNTAYYYIDAGSGESSWSIPLTEATDPASLWVKCFDYENNMVFFTQCSTGEERYSDETPTDAGWYASGAVPDPDTGLVWVEAWDGNYNLPYYVHFKSGMSQWEWPMQPGAFVVQYGSEDYNWWWKWLAQGEDGTSPPKADIKGSAKNLFGSCFA